MKMDRVFLITSVISVSDKKLSYSPRRSVFSIEERIAQTIKTIDSIRQYDIDAKILIVEGGSRNYEQIFSKMVAKYVYINPSIIKRIFVDNRNRGLGEVFMMLSSLKYLESNSNFHLFKVSGRYYLDSLFDYSVHTHDMINVHSYSVDLNNKSSAYKAIFSNGFHTVLYSFGSDLMPFFKRILIYSLPFLMIGIGIETIFYHLVNKKIVNNIETLGVSGWISVKGNFISI
jgi:hypothetical protein